jgi:hypothetical protein
MRKNHPSSVKAPDHKPRKSLPGHKKTNGKSIQALLSRVERVLSVARVQSGEEDIQFWRSRSFHDRLFGLQQLRRQWYGHDASARLQRLFEVAQQA